MKHDTANDNLRVYSGKETHAAGVELRVWWIPQVPMEPFEYRVPTLEAAKVLCDALAQYDLFQYEKRVKPDYNNAGGASWRHLKLTGGEWHDFDPEDEDECREVEAAIAEATGVREKERPDITALQESLAAHGFFADIWSIEDVKLHRPDLTDEQCMEVLEATGDSGQGITQETIASIADDLFGEED